MRHLLTAAVILFGGCDMASAIIDAQQVAPSEVSSTDAIQSIYAAQLVRSGKRFLRTPTAEQPDDEWGQVDEERRMEILTKQLSKLASFTKNTEALKKVDEAVAAAKPQNAMSLEQNLMSKLGKNQLAQRNFEQYIDEKWTVDVLKSKLRITKDTAPDSKEYEAFSTLLQTRMYVDTLMKVKNPTTTNTGETMLAKINENPLAQKYFGQFMDDTLTQVTLKNKLGITRGTLKTSKEYDALTLLIQARAWNSMLAKTKGSPLKENIMGRVEGSPLAQKFFKEFVDEKWSIQTLQSKLGITKGMTPDTTKYDALSGLVQSRMYINGVAKAKNPTVRSNTEGILTKIDDNALAQKYFGQFMDESLTLTALKRELKVTRSTPKDSKEYQAVILLIQAKALNKNLA
ncbi:hypothetical protein PInf_017995 [Phytophthora infestans]|nr:hypothetical protein PInf_017635 [Phytophthora infestans]KAI9992561.1 hypothetical protein PInf_017995 [Phytophthora infestans]